MELLRLEGLSKRYIGTQALDHVDLSVGTGEVLCLAGANGSGKSTLMKCVVGAETPDSGQIVWQGQSFSKLTPAQSRRLGIDIIYQDLSIFPEQTVAENVAFHAIQSGRRGWISWSEIDRIASEALDKIGAKLPLHTRLSDLPIGARQTTAIARALTGDCRLLVMDEPTTALPSRDVARLLETVRRLKDDGISIIFISHKLEELFDIADRFVILRDGRKVAEHAPSELTSKRLSFLMTGLEFDSSKASQDLAVSAPIILSVENLTREKQYQNVSFSLKAGETIGFAGLTGAGRTEIALSLYGLNPPDSGTVTIAGKALNAHSPLDAIQAGIALVSEDRQTQGLFPRKPIKENIAAASYQARAGAFGTIPLTLEREIGDEWVRRVHVKTPSSDEPVQTLSGGNQQKVVLAKCLATDPKILIMDNPTVGIDVGSKAEIHEIVRDLARQGRSIIMISDDLEELVMSCNRVFVMEAGKLVAEFSGEELTTEALSARLRSES